MRLSLTVLLVGFFWPLPVAAQAPTREQKKVTVDWIQSLQKEDGGFAESNRSSAGADLAATVRALRALKYFGGEPAKPEVCKAFVTRCYEKTLSGFAPVPGGKPDVRSTAMGLMAAADLKLPADQYVLRPVIFLCTSVKNFDEIRLAAAAYEAVQTKCELAGDWAETIRRMQNGDGTFGKDPDRARDTAGAAVALMRLGAPIEKQDNVLKALREGQLKDGGWGSTGQKSDLESTYRVLRAFVMLKQQPDTQAAQEFVASCRNLDGSYGLKPGEQGTMRTTYYAGSILRWLNELSLPPKSK